MNPSATGIRKIRVFAPPKHVLLITYDLKTSGHDYAPFYEALKQHGVWWHYLGSTWLTVTSSTPQELYGELNKHLGKFDLMLIVTIIRPYWGSLPKEAWDWIEKNLGGDGGIGGDPDLQRRLGV